MGIIRLLLALAVVATHFGGILGTKLVGGQVAVQSFYIISGFYMSLILNEKYIGKYSSYKLFITNRFLRLYPMYWIVLMLTIIFCITIPFLTNSHFVPVFNNYTSVHKNIFSFFFLAVTNILIFGQDTVMFLGINADNGHLFFSTNFMDSSPALFNFLFIPQAWTLALELMFYLVAPFLLVKGLKFVGIIIILSVLLRLFIYHFLGYKNDPWTYRFFPTEISFFLSGYISYRIYIKAKKMEIPKCIYLIMFFCLISFTIFFNYLPSIIIRISPFSIKEIIYYLGIIISIPLMFRFFKNNQFDNKIGELSYPVYLSHMLVGWVCIALGNNLIQNGSVIALLTIILSWFLNFFIAKPIEKYRQARVNTIS